MMLGDVVLLALYWLGVLAISCLNWLLGWMAGLVVALVDAVKILGSVVRGATRVTLVPVAGLVTAAWCLTWFARSAVRYLTSGALIEIPALLVFGLVGVSALTGVWMALCGLPLARSGRSALRSATVSGAWLLILNAVGGWVLGLYGAFGHGPIQVGWFTGSSTAVLLLIGAIATFRARSRARHV
jgi:hypothetical protein